MRRIGPETVWPGRPRPGTFPSCFPPEQVPNGAARTLALTKRAECEAAALGEVDTKLLPLSSAVKVGNLDDDVHYWVTGAATSYQHGCTEPADLSIFSREAWNSHASHASIMWTVCSHRHRCGSNMERNLTHDTAGLQQMMQPSDFLKPTLAFLMRKLEKEP